MAISTAGTYLMYKKSSTFEKLCDIINYPDMGAEPNKIDTTDLSALKMKTSILGLQEAPDLNFEANYDKATYDKIKALEGTTQDFELQFGENGADGKYDWKGQLIVYITGGGVDEARKMTIVISAETEITAGV